MPAIPPTQIVKVILEAIEQSGGSGVYISDRVQTHPRRFAVNYLNDDFTLWVYIWTLTHGGGTARPQNEYRIQLTTVQPPLRLNPNGITLLLGYFPNLNVFAGYDISQHIDFTRGSSSVQIGLRALEDALQNGLSFYERTNSEIAVGVRPDQFLNYAVNAKHLHHQGMELMPVLQKAALLQDVSEEVQQQPTEERKRVITEVSRLSRNAKVLDAYSNRCAVTRMQLKLVEAAHILPVAVEGSTDETINGIALSPTIHRAFDKALIFLDDSYIMRLNQERVEELNALGLINGLVDLQTWLDKTIHLPQEKSLRPSVNFIRQANQYRRIPGY